MNSFLKSFLLISLFFKRRFVLNDRKDGYLEIGIVPQRLRAIDEGGASFFHGHGLSSACVQLLELVSEKKGGDKAAFRAMRAELERLRNADERGQHLEDDLREAELETFKFSRRLSRARREAARLLEQVLESELSDLNMARTRFVVSFSPAELPEEDALGHNLDNADLLDVLEVEENEGTSDRLQLGVKGFDQVEFLISPNVGESPKPLAKIASGGELSRFLLALKVQLATRSDGMSMVFDEIDRGGRVALGPAGQPRHQSEHETDERDDKKGRQRRAAGCGPWAARGARLKPGEAFGHVRLVRLVAHHVPSVSELA